MFKKKKKESENLWIDHGFSGKFYQISISPPYTQKCMVIIGLKPMIMMGDLLP